MVNRMEIPRVIGDMGIEPRDAGMYVDRDGDIWEKRLEGWRLVLQSGVAVDPVSLWDWIEGHVRDYAPFLPVAAVSR